MVLKPDQIGRSDLFNWEPTFNPVRLWQKIENSLKIDKWWKSKGSTQESKTGVVESVTDRLIIFCPFLA